MYKYAICFEPINVVLEPLVRPLVVNVHPHVNTRVSVATPNNGLAPPNVDSVPIQGPYTYCHLSTKPGFPSGHVIYAAVIEYCILGVSHLG